MSRIHLALRLPLCCVLLALCTPALARIDPLRRCTLTLSPAMVDYGQVSANVGVQLQKQAGVVLPTRTVHLNLACPQPINLTMLFHAPSLDPMRFDFGGAGFYTLRVHDVRVDAVAADIGRVTVPGEPPSEVAETLIWSPERAWVPVRAGLQVSGSTLSALIDVQTTLTAGVGSIRDAQAWEAGGNIDVEDAREFVRLDLRAHATPGSCTPRLTPAALDLGAVQRAALRTDAANPLPRRSVQLQVNCSGPTRMAVKLLDNRAGSDPAGAGWVAAVHADARFALTRRAGGVVGVYALSFGAVMADGQPMQLLRGTGEQASDWGALEEGAALERFDARGAVYSFSPPGRTTPVPMIELSAPLQVDVQLAPSSLLEATSEVLIDGSVTIEMVYL
jgi:hypothetical protein